jgi:hypothetical protein
VVDKEVILEAANLRVVFFRQGDRWAHRIEVQHETTGAWSGALESLEGSADDVWPPSPPFQQLHVEHRPTGDVVLLVGMAGRTHWSAAVETTPDRQAIRFDVAARLQQLPPESIRLKSEYRDCREDAKRVQPRVVITWQLGEPPRTAPATCAWQWQIKLRDDDSCRQA